MDGNKKDKVQVTKRFYSSFFGRSGQKTSPQEVNPEVRNARRSRRQQKVRSLIIVDVSSERNDEPVKNEESKDKGELESHSENYAGSENCLNDSVPPKKETSDDENQLLLEDYNIEGKENLQLMTRPIEAEQSKDEIIKEEKSENTTIKIEQIKNRTINIEQSKMNNMKAEKSNDNSIKREQSRDCLKAKTSQIADQSRDTKIQQLPIGKHDGQTTLCDCNKTNDQKGRNTVGFFDVASKFNSVSDDSNYGHQDADRKNVDGPSQVAIVGALEAVEKVNNDIGMFSLHCHLRE